MPFAATEKIISLWNKFLLNFEIDPEFFGFYLEDFGSLHNSFSKIKTRFRKLLPILASQSAEVGSKLCWISASGAVTPEKFGLL